MQFSINPQKITRVLLLITLVLTIFHCGVLLAYFIIDDPEKFDFVRLIDFDYEGNIPTLFSSLLMLISAALFFLLARITYAKTPWHKKYWLGLAWVFLFLGIDEGTKIHEHIGDWVEQFVSANDYLYFPWVLPYILVLTVLVAIYFRFYLSLPRPLQKRLLLAAILFLSGAVGLDMIGGREADINGTSTIYYSVLYTVEEILEMIGVIVLIHSLMVYIGEQTNTLKVTLK